MPIYEYKCRQCDTVFETLVLGSDIPTCPSCSSRDLSRLLSACGFVTSGGGSGAEGAAPSASTSSACSGCSATNCGSCTG